MPFAKLNASGFLSSMRAGPQQPGGVWPDGSKDVPLKAFPETKNGPWTYDAENQLAVPVPPTVPAVPATTAGLIDHLAKFTQPTMVLWHTMLTLPSLTDADRLVVETAVRKVLDSQARKRSRLNA